MFVWSFAHNKTQRCASLCRCSWNQGELLSRLRCRVMFVWSFAHNKTRRCNSLCRCSWNQGELLSRITCQVVLVEVSHKTKRLDAMMCRCFWIQGELWIPAASHLGWRQLRTYVGFDGFWGCPSSIEDGSRDEFSMFIRSCTLPSSALPDLVTLSGW